MAYARPGVRDHAPKDCKEDCEYRLRIVHQGLPHRFRLPAPTNGRGRAKPDPDLARALRVSHNGKKRNPKVQAPRHLRRTGWLGDPSLPMRECLGDSPLLRVATQPHGQREKELAPNDTKSRALSISLARYWCKEDWLTWPDIPYCGRRSSSHISEVLVIVSVGRGRLCLLSQKPSPSL
jgi:hypothetical protein